MSRTSQSTNSSSRAAAEENLDNIPLHVWVSDRNPLFDSTYHIFLYNLGNDNATTTSSDATTNVSSSNYWKKAKICIQYL